MLREVAMYLLDMTRTSGQLCLGGRQSKPFVRLIFMLTWGAVVRSPILTTVRSIDTKPTTSTSFLTFICPCIASISLKYNQQDAMFSRSIYFHKLLYMFQAVPPPIIRSTKLYILLLLNRRYNSLRVLARSTIVLHKFLSNTFLFQFLIFIFCKSILTSSSHLFFGLPFGLEASGFHL